MGLFKRKRKLSENQKEILEIIGKMWAKYPHQRFTQLLHNLDISQFANLKHPEEANYNYRDNYNDLDEDVLNRIKNAPMMNES